ncbi:hypothetical protein Ddye_012732 [Dipteronia dyeriana]|uniref:Phorbol-ester/DAG-type domain-containing protein n=1 Tax=Dipteronia dyeriana TaxID=168575 RepID=A0AAD9X4V4_9ROSI|nr:hypothetical protein Ddye_012732 [Dipteronia dyeriana]
MMNILERAISNNYEFTYYEFFEEKYGTKYCSVCCKVIRGPAYIAEEDDAGNNIMHKACAELPGEIQQHPFHSKHTLTINCRFNQNRVNDMICDGCRHVSSGLKFRCKMCKFNLDFQCISKHHHQGATLKEKVERLILKYHPHKLQLLYFSRFKARDSMFCCCCLKSILDSAYVCFPCKLFIHESCFDTIPERTNSSFHPQHPLQRSIISTTAVREPRYCQACGERIEGIELRCQNQKCKYSRFHVSCGKRTTPGLTLGDHEHKLFYIDYWDHSGVCDVCTNACERGAAICRCIQHGESFHIDCILPPVLSHESHDHPLSLTNSVVPRCNPDEYHCDVCETKGDIKRHVYHCDECYYIAHIECVLAEDQDPPLKMIVKSKDDSEQQNNDQVQEVEAEVHIEKMEEDEAKDDQEINELEESDVDDLSEESDDDDHHQSEKSSDESEKNSDEEQKTKKLNKLAQDVKGKIDKLTSKHKRIEEKLKLIYKS